MTKEGDIPTIFNPRRGRTPSVVVTDEGVAANGPFTHTDSVGSNQQETAGAGGGEQISSPTAGQTTTVRGRLKSCSSSLCSQSARKVSALICDWRHLLTPPMNCVFIEFPLVNRWRCPTVHHLLSLLANCNCAT